MSAGTSIAIYSAILAIIIYRDTLTPKCLCVSRRIVTNVRNIARIHSNVMSRRDTLLGRISTFERSRFSGDSRKRIQIAPTRINVEIENSRDR